MPVGRRPFEIAELAPGVTDNTPNVGQMAVGGAFAFDSIFLIDGVDTNDNLFGTSNNLFIEDAIQETQVLIGGISAEYGRFGGGVVNVITKSGGNQFQRIATDSTSGEPVVVGRDAVRDDATARATLSAKCTKARSAARSCVDRLWFFNADRYENVDDVRDLRRTRRRLQPDDQQQALRAEADRHADRRPHASAAASLNNPLTERRICPPSTTTMSMTEPRRLIDRRDAEPALGDQLERRGDATSCSRPSSGRGRIGIRNAGGTSTAIHRFAVLHSRRRRRIGE